MASTASTARVKRAIALIGVLVASASALVGCSTATPTSELPNVSTAQSTSTVETTSTELEEQELDGLPFTILARTDALKDAELVGAETVPAHPSVTITGTTTVPEDGLPGPSIRTLLMNDKAFAAKLEPLVDGPIQGLAEVPSTLGFVDADGSYKEIPSLTEDLIVLPNSNDDELYFEPQDASSFEHWVVWREGSAGSSDGFPTLDTDDFRIVFWDQRTEAPIELASSFLLHGSRFAPRGTWSAAPYTDGQSVFFEAVLPDHLASGLPGGSMVLVDDEGNEWVQVVSEVPITEPGDVSFLARGTSPVATTSGPLWVEDTKRVNTPQGPLFELPAENWHIGAVTTDGNQVAVTVVGPEEANAWILLWDPAAETLRAAVDARAPWAQVSVSGESLAWGNGTSGGEGQMFLWELGNPSLEALGNSPGMSIPHLNGRQVAIPSLSDSGAVLWTLAEVGK